jgi:hypothetical protein
MKRFAILPTMLFLLVAGGALSHPSFNLQFAICNDQFSIASAPRLAVDDPVQSGRDAMNHWFGYPWYDSSADDLKRVDIPTPSTPWSFNWRLGTLLEWLAWTLLAVLIIVLIYWAAKTFFQRVPTVAVETVPAFERTARDRIESLPFPIAVGKMNLLDEARRLYQEGEYARAIVYLFSYQLVELDNRHRIRLTKGKTNRQYLREVGSPSPLRQLVEHTMIAFEDAFFGHHMLDQTRFESCWFRLGEFEQLNAEGTAKV